MITVEVSQQSVEIIHRLLSQIGEAHYIMHEPCSLLLIFSVRLHMFGLDVICIWHVRTVSDDGMKRVVSEVMSLFERCLACDLNLTWF